MTPTPDVTWPFLPEAKCPVEPTESIYHFIQRSVSETGWGVVVGLSIACFMAMGALAYCWYTNCLVVGHAQNKSEEKADMNIEGDKSPLLQELETGHAQNESEEKTGTNIEKETLQILRELETKDSKGRTYLSEAVYEEKYEDVKSALENGANPDAKDGFDWTPLMVAATLGNVGIVELLLEYKANVKAMDDLNNTALHLATEKGHFDVVKLLHLKGAELDAKNALNLTAMESAVAHKHQNIIDYLAEILKKGPSSEEGKSAQNKGNSDLLYTVMEDDSVERFKRYLAQLADPHEGILQALKILAKKRNKMNIVHYLDNLNKTTNLVN